jgi:predicted RNA-binding protein with PIN domain
VGRAALHRLLAPVAQRLGDEFILVFDGARPVSDEEIAGQVRFIFSQPPETADDVVMRLAAQWREGAIVVSSDRTIRQAASRGGSPVLTVAEFLSGLHAEADDSGEEDDDSGPRDKRGNPRRLSREERAARRALRRLRG